MLKSLAIKIAGHYAVKAVQDAITAKKDDIIFWCARVGTWISKIESVLAFLKSLRAKLEDGVLTDDEGKSALAEAKQLKAEVM